MTQGETQMQTQEADGLSLTMFINPKGSRQENGHGPAKRSKPVQSPGGTEWQLVVKAGRMVRQAGTESRNRQGSKPGGLEKGE